MEHRIRSAGVLIRDNHLLLLKVKDLSGEYWIPPGGGFEPGDTSTKACLKREFMEEAALEVEVGELLCVREFLETAAGRYNAEFFYHILSYRGVPSIENLSGLNDEAFIQAIEWVPISKLRELRTYPADMPELVEMALTTSYSKHLGSYIQGADETTNHL